MLPLFISIDTTIWKRKVDYNFQKNNSESNHAIFKSIAVRMCLIHWWVLEILVEYHFILIFKNFTYATISGKNYWIESEYLGHLEDVQIGFYSQKLMYNQ